MKHVLMAALIALFAVSFTMAQDQVAKKQKSTQTTTQKKAGCCAEAKETAAAKECAGEKDCADMKDCSAAKDAKMSKQGTEGEKEVVKTAEKKVEDTK